jgi:hypothetical protein
MENIQLPADIAKKYDLVQQPSSDELYFGSAVGTVKFSEMTEAQASRLVQMGSPYLKLKDEAQAPAKATKAS